MKKLCMIFTGIAMLCINAKGFSQGVGINLSGASADASSMLDVTSTNKGILIPRLTKSQRDAIISPVKSLLVYQTDNEPGFYFYNGSNWRAFLSGDTTSTSGWVVKGNTNIDPNKHFIGTIDSVDFSTHTNSSQRMVIKGNGNIGIGTSTPGWKTEIQTEKNAITGTDVEVSELALVVSKNNNTNNEAVGIGFQCSETSTVIGAAIIHERVGNNSKGGLHFATKKTTSEDATIPIRMTITDSGAIYMNGVYNQGVNGFIQQVYVGPDGLLGGVLSSRKYKTNITNMEDLSWLYQLRPVNFNYKTDTSRTKQYGLIAEEVEAINPLFAIYDKKGEVNSVNYSFLIAPLLKAVQDQRRQIEGLERKLDEVMVVLGTK